MTLTPFDPLVVDVLSDPATIAAWRYDQAKLPALTPGRISYLRDGVLYEFTPDEVKRAEHYFLRIIERERPGRRRRRMW